MEKQPTLAYVTVTVIASVLAVGVSPVGSEASSRVY